VTSPPGRRDRCGQPGRTIATEAIRGVLVRHGIHPRASRSAAMFALAGQIPTPILADLVGISTGKAAALAKLAARAWSDCVANRTARMGVATPQRRRRGRHVAANAIGFRPGRRAERRRCGHVAPAAAPSRDQVATLLLDRLSRRRATAFHRVRRSGRQQVSEPPGLARTLRGR